MFISRKIVDVEGLLVEAGYIEELKPFHNEDPKSRNYTTRIRHTEILRDMFAELTIDRQDVDTHANEKCIILDDRYVDDPDDDTIGKIEYSDNDLPDDELALLVTRRGQLTAYNKLLKHTFIDIPSYTQLLNTIRLSELIHPVSNLVERLSSSGG